MRISRMLKALLTSKNLFSNWLSAGIKYFLVRHGMLRRRISVRCDSVEYLLRPVVYSFIVNAYYDGILRVFSCEQNMLKGRLWGAIDLIMLRNGETYLVMPDGVKIYFDFFDPLVIAEIWLYEIHFLGHDLSNWFVLDVGAYIGDTALYYAKRGAFVVAVEPLPCNYEAMLKNIELNPDLKSRIIPINVAIGPEDGYAEFGYSRSVDGGASMYCSDRRRVRVRSVKLSTLVKEISTKGIDLNKFKFKVLKMDCKGCEYDVIREPDALEVFDVRLSIAGF